MCAKTVYQYTPEMEHYLISPGGIDETLDFAKIFGNDHPVEIEIGTGKGRFILAESLLRPATNFLGIERSRKWLRIALLRAAYLPRANCFFLCLDADLVVKLLILPQSVSAYHIYFPDPWPKERHHKRRLFNPRFVEKTAQTLIPQGRLFLKTDHTDYFAEAHANIVAGGFFQVREQRISEESISDFDEAPDTATHYEVKFRQESRKIYTASYQVTDVIQPDERKIQDFNTDKLHYNNKH